MTVATRNAAHDQHRESGKAGTQCDLIVGLLKTAKLPLLRDEIAARLGMRISSVCGRLDELQQRRLVVVDGERVNPFTGKACDTYRLTGPADAIDTDQADMFAEAMQ